MDDQITKTPTHPIIDVMPTQSSIAQTASVKKSLFHNKKTLGIVVGIVVVLIVGIVVWILTHHKKVVLTPAQTLQQLKDSSEPVTSTPQQRATELSETHKSSIQYGVTTKRQTDTLNALGK